MRFFYSSISSVFHYFDLIKTENPSKSQLRFPIEESPPQPRWGGDSSVGNSWGGDSSVGKIWGGDSSVGLFSHAGNLQRRNIAHRYKVRLG